MMNKSKSNTDQVKLTEHLSALLDDEAGSFEQRRVLDELKVDDKLCEKLSHYALIGEAMRSESSQMTVSSKFLSGIHAQINDEPEYHQIQIEDKQVAKTRNSWLKPVGGFAMAASVAAIAVLGIQNYQKSSPLLNQSSTIAQNNIAPMKGQLSKAEMDSARVVSAAKMVAKNDTVISDTSEYSLADARTRSFLKRYVDSHMQHAGATTFVPSVRVIAYADY
jgi:negative regulator of sigma E activity